MEPLEPPNANVVGRRRPALICPTQKGIALPAVWSHLSAIGVIRAFTPATVTVHGVLELPKL